VSAPVLDLLDCPPAARGGPAGDGIGTRALRMLAPVPGIRGREAETAVLDDAIDRAATGRLAVVLIDGEAGIGKTRLLQDALEKARRRGLRVAAARAAELERTRPFGLVAAMFGCTRSAPDPRRAAIGELLASGDRGDFEGRGPVTVTSDPGLQFRAVDAFAGLAGELALDGPLVLGADDLHWADPSSLVTLGALAARLDGLPAAIIGCFRPAPAVAGPERLASALEAAGGRRLSLRGLDGRAVAELVANAVGAAPGRRLLAGISGAAGNPLFVTELLGALAQEQMITICDGQAEVAGLTRPHDPDTDGQVRVGLAHALLAQGQVRDALGELDRASRSPRLAEAERAPAHAWAGFARISLGDLDGAAASVTQARAGAAGVDHLTASIIVSTTARISESRGHLAEALELAEEAVRRADASPGRR
jgi:AAA ATPase domain